MALHLVCLLVWDWYHSASSQAHLHVLGMLRFMFLTYTNRACPLLFIRSIFVSFCLYCPFTCISFHKFSQQLSAFSLCSSGLISALLVLSTIYLFLEVSFSPGKILCGWLGLKHQLTNRLNILLLLKIGGNLHYRTLLSLRFQFQFSLLILIVSIVIFWSSVAGTVGV